jgi:hypothetical protein
MVARIVYFVNTVWLFAIRMARVRMLRGRCAADAFVDGFSSEILRFAQDDGLLGCESAGGCGVGSAGGGLRAGSWVGSAGGDRGWVGWGKPAASDF